VSVLAFTRSLTPALLAALLAPATAAAADGEKTPLNLTDAGAQAAEHAAGGGGGTLVRTIVGLAVVLAVIWGISWVLRQVKASREGATGGAGLQPIATLPLGPNRALHLIRAGTEVVLVGAGEHGVVPVRTYTEQEARELGLIGDEDEPPAPPPPSSGGLLPRPKRNWMDELRARTVIK
jgi:flagellar protein FliO/FliZ